jgi:hypothetical protein
MTSGQGGNQPGGQYGPPEGWNPPPGQGGYDPGRPYPGYNPAPSAPTGQGAPPAMDRPTTVRAGIGAFVASLLVGLISSAVTLSDFDAFIDRAMAASAGNPDVTEELLRTSLEIGLVFGLILVALQVMFIWFAWIGHNWARIVLWVLGGLGVAFGLLGLAQDTGQTGFSTSMGAFQLLFTAAGIVLLAMKPSNEWYRYRSWQRTTGQR